MSDRTAPRIAIIGSGPAGCYLAQALLRALPDSEFVVFDRLASPFGLIRYGVAADHQHTKAIIRQFERLFASPNVRFAGNIEVGCQVSLDELRALFDAVVLATGLSDDQPLELPGGELAGVHGAGTLTRLLNSHPDGADFPDLGDDVVIIGAGNVALDVLRFLVKDQAGYVASDVADAELAHYLSRPAARITLASRSAAPFSKGDPQMLKEIAALERAHYSAPHALEATAGTELDRTQAARVAAIAELVSPDRPAHPGPQVTLRFGVTPVRIVGEHRVTGVEFADDTGTVTVPATGVVTAIGFRAAGTGPLDALVATSAESGRLAPGLYRTGWAKRGPKGAIPENRACAKSVADEILDDLASGALAVSADTLGFAGLSPEVRERAVDYRQWQVLDAYEQSEAEPDRVRRKFADHDRMVSIAKSDG